VFCCLMISFLGLVFIFLEYDDFFRLFFLPTIFTSCDTAVLISSFITSFMYRKSRGEYTLVPALPQGGSSKTKHKKQNKLSSYLSASIIITHPSVPKNAVKRDTFYLTNAVFASSIYQRTYSAR